MRSFIPRVGIAVVGSLATTLALAQSPLTACGSLNSAYGPFDYRTERSGKLQIVEAFHFTPEVEALIRGRSGDLAADLSYTLRTSPNHHRALVAVVRLGERTKSPQPPNLQYSIECYFDRAVRFRPDDTVVRSLYAQYLGKQGRKREAEQQLEIAASQAKENAVSQYNIGLVYFELKDYDRALSQAHKAMGLGYTRPELEDMLKRAGEWREPELTPQEAPAASAVR
jgi:tetratricopeptide (TPR) repeat protein